MNQQQENNFFNLINILSFALGWENLQENREQSRFNDVHEANDRQAEYLLVEIKRLFDKQNEMIERQNTTIEELIEEIKKLRGG